MENDLVSIAIPTKNSSRYIRACLDSIKKQKHTKIEVIVVDAFSTDNTIEICKSYGANIVQSRWNLLGARYLGLKHSKGKFILFLDSDQILIEDDKIAECVKYLKNDYDMLHLEERVFKPRTWLHKLYDADKRFIQPHVETYLNPKYGAIVGPRFFKREIISKAFENMDKKLFPDIFTFEDAIIFHESYKISMKVGSMSFALYHDGDPSTLVDLWKKYFMYGKNSKKLKNHKYNDLFANRKIRRHQKYLLNNFKLGIQSDLLMILKGIPYQCGRYFG